LTSNSQEKTAPTLPTPVRPVLAARVSVEVSDAGVVLEGSLRRRRMTGPLGEAFLRMRPLLDGTHSVSSICEALSDEYEPDDITTLVAQLYGENFIREADEQRPGVSGLEFYAVLRDWIVEQALTNIDRSAYVTEMQAGRWTKTLFAGFALELYHFFKSVFDHAAVAIETAPNMRIKQTWVRFLHEEHAHPKMMAECAHAVGVPMELVLQSQPIPSTQARISHLINLARVEPLAYAAVVAFIESTGGNAAVPEHGKPSDPFIEHLRATYSLPETYLTNLLKHRTENVVGVHSELGAEVFSTISFIDKDAQRRIIRATARSMDVELQFMNGLFRYYSDPAAKVPFMRDDGLASLEPTREE
jgi:pyrroloquinoline quinone (PQQ) biosynthesis protein C